MFSVFRNINRFAGKSKILDGVFIFCARYLIYLMVLLLLIAAWVFHSRGLFVYPLLSGLCAAFIFNKVIYIFYKEARPSEFKGTNILIPVPENPSFPSRHAAVIFGISFFLFRYNLDLAMFFTICACLIGISRVFCGVHWFKDIVVGALIGLLSSLVMFILISSIR